MKKYPWLTSALLETASEEGCCEGGLKRGYAAMRGDGELFLEDLMWLARKAYCPLEALHEFARHPETQMRQMVALNHQLPPDLIRQLSYDSCEWVRGYIAIHPNTPVELLAKFATDSHFRVRQFVAEVERLPIECHEPLSKDPEPYVRRYLAKNPKLSRVLLETLVEDPTRAVSVAAMEQLILMGVAPAFPGYGTIRSLSRDEALQKIQEFHRAAT